jgi:hypothetical protein
LRVEQRESSKTACGQPLPKTQLIFSKEVFSAPNLPLPRNSAVHLQ